jgi:large subunit ribosomal protein L30
MSEKEKSPKKDVDALLTEVASAAGVPKKAAKPSGTPAPAAKAAAPAPKAGPAKKTIRIRQIRSGICTPVDQKQALRGLGLRRIRHEVVRPDTPAIRGQILKVRHLVEVVGE